MKHPKSIRGRFIINDLMRIFSNSDIANEIITFGKERFTSKNPSQNLAAIIETFPSFASGGESIVKTAVPEIYEGIHMWH